MKKINTFKSLLFFFLLLFVTQFSIAQDGKDYDSKKANFWNLYLQYKENLKTNPFTPKPIDPSGLFRIDDNNNFTNNSQSIIPQQTDQSGPWINQQTNTAAAYTWSQTTGTYTAVSGTVLGTNANDDNTFSLVPIGFSFVYDGVPYTTIDVNANGYIRFGTITGSHYPQVLSLQTNIFAGCNNDLRANNTTSTLQYTTTGSVGSRKMTIQWSNYGFYNSGYDGSDISFQVILSENTNTLQVVYGNYPTIVVVPYTTQAGMNTTLVDFNNRTTTTDWAATTAGGTNAAGLTLTGVIKPASGLTYTWTPIPMTYTSSNNVQVSPGVIARQNTTNNPVIQIQIVTGGGSGALVATSFNVGTNGSTNPPGDITNAKIYYTGTSGTFASTNLYGTQVSPNGTFAIAGNQGLAVGTNYFWLTYDVPPTATIGNLLDGQCNSFTIGSTQVPSTIAPAGSRPVGPLLAPFCGTVNVPGDYASLSALFTDLNTVGITCPTVVNIAAGYTESNVNLTLTCPVNPPNSINTLTFQKSGAGANPLLTAGTGVSTTVDGIIILNGINYVTFDGIDLQENAANVTPTTQMEWGYALVKQTGVLGSSRNTIKNCTITLDKTNPNSVGIYSANHTTASTTTLTVTSLIGTNSYNKFLSNTIQNSFMGYRLFGYSAASPYDFYDQGNEIGNTGSRRSQVLNYGNNISGLAAYGIYTINQNLVKVHHTYINSTGGTDNNSTIYGIYISTATNASTDIYNDTVTVKGSSTTANMYGITWECGATGQGNTNNVYNNVVTGCTYPTSTSAIFRGFMNAPSSSATATFNNVYNNTVSNNTLPGTGEFSGFYLSASLSANMVTMNVYGNTVTGNTKTGTAGNMYMCYINGNVQQKSFYNNTITNNSNATSVGGLTYGYYNFGTDFSENIYNNIITGNTGGTGTFDCIEATSGSGLTDKLIYNNTINGNTGAGLVIGLVVEYSTNVRVYRNNIYNLTSTNAAGLAPAVAGISFGTNVNQNCFIYNNFISELKAPSATNINSIYGIWLRAPGNVNLYYNTIYLNASSSSTTFGSSGIVYSGTGTTLPLLDLRNNIIVNASTPGTSGRTVALQRATTNLTNYNILSGNNCLYAGSPSATNLIHFDGTNSDQNIQSFKDRMGARDQASFTEIPPFVNIGASPYDLHIQTGTGTQTEKGGQPMTAVTEDYDGTSRSAITPDVGADEFAGTMNDIASPLIIFTPLGNGTVAASRTATNFAVITDPSNINTTAGTRPRIYYKKSTQTNTINDNTSGTDGWKWVEASNTSSPFSFTIDYTILFGGSVAAADVIQYFVVAQDLNGTPRVGINAGGLASQPASVNLAVGNTPVTITNTNSYTISASAPLSGTVTVGTLGGENYPSLTNAGGLFAAINSASLSGNLVVNITSDLTAELGTNGLNQWSETGPGGYTVTIQPSSASQKIISGTVANGLVRLDNASRVTIDGRFGGSGSYLMFRNLNTSNACLQILNDAQNNMIRNCIFESSNTSTASGAIVLGTTTKANGNDNNTITYNEIRNRTDVVAYYAQGIYCAGTVTTVQTYNNNCTISNNNIHDFFIDGGVQQGGILVSTGNANFNIDSNSVYQTATRTMTITGALGYGIFISNSSAAANYGGINIRKNYVGGSAPLAGGTPLTWTVSSTTQLLAFNGIRCVSGQIPNFVTDNTIANFDLTSNNTATNNFIFLGIGTGNGIWNCKRNTIGSPVGNDNIKITLNTGGAGLNIIRGIYMAHFTATVGFGGTIDSNNVGSITVGGNTTVNGAYLEPVGIGGNALLVNNPSISYNLIGSTTTPNSIRFTYATAVSNLRFLSCFAVSQTITVNANRWQNITDQSTGSSAFFTLFNGAPGNCTHIITNNTWSDINSSTSAGLGSVAVLYLASISPNEVVSGNTMQNINLTNTSALSNGLIGMLTITANAIGGTFSKNKMYNINNLQTGPSPSVVGAYFNVGADWDINNNMIALTNGEPLAANVKNEMKHDNRVDVPYVDHAVYNIPAGTNLNPNMPDSKTGFEMPTEQIYNIDAPVLDNSFPGKKSTNSNISKDSKPLETNGDFTTNTMALFGIYDVTNGGTKTLAYNTVYIGGVNAGGANNSFCFDKTGTGNVSLRNNLFYNNRTGTGVHYAIGNDGGTPSTGWLSNASNYNAFVTTDSNAVGSWGLTAKSIDQWRTSSSGDNQSWSTKTSVITPANLFTSVSTGNLNINSGNSAAWLVSGKGIALTNYSTDYSGSSRSTSISNGCTDIGANEFAATPPSSPVALQSGAPNSGGTTDYVLFGRKVATVNWGTGGTYPTALNITYNSGVSPLAPNVTNPNRTSNSYWTAVPTGTFSGTTYDITWFYGDNETYTITSPATNVLLGKNDNSFWMTYPQGNGNLQSELNPSVFSVKARGLFGFSSFTLSDAALPAEFPRTPGNNATGQPANITLVWSKSNIASTYRIQLATDSLFNTLIVNDSTVTDTTKLVSGLINNTNYWWRVNGKNGTGTGGWSQVFKFNVNFVVAPAAPTLFSPANNSTNQPVALNLVWFKSVSAASYRVQLSTENTFTTGLVVNDSTLTDSIRAVSGLINSTTYFWRVNAKNVAGTSIYSTVWQFTTAPLGPANVNLTIIPGGFYNTANGRLNMRDTIRVYLVDSVSCVTVDSAKGVVDSVNYTANISFSNANTGNYYLLVYHRNHLGLATRFKATVTRGASVGYDFTTDSAKAFGFNMVKVSNSPVRWAMIPGDANRDGFVDGLDQTAWLAQNGFDGYLPADFNGDNFVDGLDQTVWLTYNGNSSFLPCGFIMDPVTNQIMVNTSDYDAKKSNRILFDRKRQDTPVENNTKQNNNRK